MLEIKGIWDYVKAINDDMIKSRMLCGFLKKKKRDKLSIDRERWIFLISSRPLVIPSDHRTWMTTQETQRS